MTGEHEHTLARCDRRLAGGSSARRRLADDLEDLSQICGQHAQVSVDRKLLAYRVYGEVGRAGKRVAVSGGNAPRLFGDEKLEVGLADLGPLIFLAFTCKPRDGCVQREFDSGGKFCRMLSTLFQ